MKHLINKAYLLIGGQFLNLLLAAYMTYYHYTTFHIMMNTKKVHLGLQVILSVLMLHILYNFIKVLKLSSKMRKAAQEQKEARSGWVEALIFILMTSIIFWSLFLAFPYKRYYPSLLEQLVYLINGLFQIILLFSVVSQEHHTSSNFLRRQQIYALSGGVSGLLLFFVYYHFV